MIAKIEKSEWSAHDYSACPERPALFVAQLPVDDEGRPKIRRVLIANRGEIACRVISTCRKLSVTSIALYVEEDAYSLHVSEADESISIGSVTEGTNPFLNVKLLVKVALEVKADAIHPGYGYLSENASFADAVREAGLIFIGPSSQAMSTLGDKRASKAFLREHEPAVPLIPGFAGSSQSVGDLEIAAEKIGFPVMLKASAGGGGKGMRIVRERSALRDELARAQSEAARSFGSDDCILEKYIEAGKHIEIQIIGDRHGRVISLFERDCSVQRRHQKVVEESPSPWLDSDKRQAMSAVAVRIGELLRYEGAGTVEFVVDTISGDFYFLEVNTRLQVEHPITEEVTGLDIVALQLFVAAGGRLASIPSLQHIPQHGHALECRLCAEDPQRDFFPEHGTIRLWRPSVSGIPSRDVRYETSVRTGSHISIYFDSMIAKVVVWAPTRSMAIERMTKALANTVCAGLRTNQGFLQSCLLHPGFRDPSYTTSFIPTNLEALVKNPYQPNLSEALQEFSAIPSIFLQNMERYLEPVATAPPRPFQHIRRGFRNQYFDPINLHSHIVCIVDPTRKQTSVLCIRKAAKAAGQPYDEVYLAPLPLSQPDLEATPGTQPSPQSAAAALTSRYAIISNAIRTGDLTKPEHNARRIAVERCDARITKGASTTDTSWVTADMDVFIAGAKVSVQLATETTENALASSTQAGRGQRVYCHFAALGTWVEYRVYSMLSFCESMREDAAGAGVDGRETQQQKAVVVAPMPCKVVSVAKQAGDAVRAGEAVMVVESMKMEMNICVAVAGTFDTALQPGDAVDEGACLCRVT